jgi:hypothetical protein
MTFAWTEAVVPTEVSREVARVGQSNAQSNLRDSERGAFEQRSRAFETKLAKVADRRHADLTTEKMRERRRG